MRLEKFLLKSKGVSAILKLRKEASQGSPAEQASAPYLFLFSACYEQQIDLFQN